MNALRFVLASPLLAPLVEFATSPSGHVEPRQGLALGWLGSVVAGLAVVLAPAEQAQADSCYGIPIGKSGMACGRPTEICAWDRHGNPLLTRKHLYVHDTMDGCKRMKMRAISTCSCPM